MRRGSGSSGSWRRRTLLSKFVHLLLGSTAFETTVTSRDERVSTSRRTCGNETSGAPRHRRDVVVDSCTVTNCPDGVPEANTFLPSAAAAGRPTSTWGCFRGASAYAPVAACASCVARATNARCTRNRPGEKSSSREDRRVDLTRCAERTHGAEACAKPRRHMYAAIRWRNEHEYTSHLAQ